MSTIKQSTNPESSQPSRLDRLRYERTIESEVAQFINQSRSISATTSPIDALNSLAHQLANSQSGDSNTTATNTVKRFSPEEVKLGFHESTVLGNIPPIYSEWVYRECLRAETDLPSSVINRSGFLNVFREMLQEGHLNSQYSMSVVGRILYHRREPFLQNLWDKQGALSGKLLSIYLEREHQASPFCLNIVAALADHQSGLARMTGSKFADHFRNQYSTIKDLPWYQKLQAAYLLIDSIKQVANRSISNLPSRPTNEETKNLIISEFGSFDTFCATVLAKEANHTAVFQRLATMGFECLGKERIVREVLFTAFGDDPNVSESVWTRTKVVGDYLSITKGLKLPEKLAQDRDQAQIARFLTEVHPNAVGLASSVLWHYRSNGLLSQEFSDNSLAGIKGFLKANLARQTINGTPSIRTGLKLLASQTDGMSTTERDELLRELQLPNSDKNPGILKLLEISLPLVVSTSSKPQTGKDPLSQQSHDDCSDNGSVSYITDVDLDSLVAARTLLNDIRAQVNLPTSKSPSQAIADLVRLNAVSTELDPTKLPRSGYHTSLYFKPDIVGKEDALRNVKLYLRHRFPSEGDLRKAALEVRALAFLAGCSPSIRAIELWAKNQGVFGQPDDLSQINDEIPTLSASKEEKKTFVKRQLSPSSKKAFDQMSDLQLQRFVDEAELTEIVKTFSGNLTEAIPLLRLFRASEFSGRSACDFLIRYKTTVPIGNPEINSSPATIFVKEFIRATNSSSVHPFLNPATAANSQQMLIKMLRRDWIQNPSIVDSFYDTIAQYAHSLPSETTAALLGTIEKVRDYFKSVDALTIDGMRTPPFRHQKEGVHFLLSGDARLLSDEVGLGKTYQALAALMTSGSRALWITTASNRSVVEEEILTHTTLKSAEIGFLSGEAAITSESLSKARIIITNYEQLVRMSKASPAEFDLLKQDMWLNERVLVVDESQRIDNYKSQRSQVVQDLRGQRVWLLSASPYQSDISRFWESLHFLDPDRFPNKSDFRDTYIKAPDGLEQLHHTALPSYVLRRVKGEVAKHFNPPHEKDFQEQLAEYAPRIPRLIHEPKANQDRFELTHEQIEALLRQPHGTSWFEQYQTASRIMFLPETAGLKTQSPLWKRLDAMVTDAVGKGEKAILWAFNTKLIDKIVERYQQHGIVRFDGTVSQEERRAARAQFQTDDSCRFIVANYSIGAGFSLTRADAAWFVQLPPHYVSLYQSIGRSHRVIGAHNANFARENMTVRYLVPTFTDKGIETYLPNPTPKQKLHYQRGTYVEQTIDRIENGAIIYSMVMEGYVDAARLQQHFLENR